MNPAKIRWIPLKRLARFGLAGLGSTGIHVFIALVLITRLQWPPPWANGIAFGVATAFSYALNTMWSFSAWPDRKTLRRFLVVASLGLLLSVVISKGVEILGYPPLIGIFGVVIVVPAISFTLHSLWTYR